MQLCRWLLSCLRQTERRDDRPCFFGFELTPRFGTLRHTSEPPKLLTTVSAKRLIRFSTVFSFVPYWFLLFRSHSALILYKLKPMNVTVNQLLCASRTRGTFSCRYYRRTWSMHWGGRATVNMHVFVYVCARQAWGWVSPLNVDRWWPLTHFKVLVASWSFIQLAK